MIFPALTASVRHQARSIAEITREHLGGRAGKAMLTFIWIALDLRDHCVHPHHGRQLRQRDRRAPGSAGSIQSRRRSCCGKHLLPVAGRRSWGWLQRFLKPPLWLLTVIFVPAALASSWFGTHVSTLLAPGCPNVGSADPGLLLRRVNGSGVGAAATARLSRWIHPLSGAGAGSHRRAVRWIRNQTGGFPRIRTSVE